MQKALESANIKLQSVVSDITGVSATEMLSGNTDAKELAQLAKYRLLPWLLNFQLNALRLRLVTRLSKKNLYGPIIPFSDEFRYKLGCMLLRAKGPQAYQPGAAPQDLEQRSV